MAAWAKDKAVKDRDRVVPKAVVRAWGKAKAVKVRVVGKVAAWAKAAKVRAPVLEAGEAKRRRVRAPEQAKAKVEPREEIPPGTSEARGVRAKGRAARWRAKAHKAVARVARRPEKVAR